MSTSWVDPIKGAAYQSGQAFKSGNTVVIGQNSNVADYGPFTSGTNTDGVSEAISSLNLNTAYAVGAVVVLGGVYDLDDVIDAPMGHSAQLKIYGIGVGGVGSTPFGAPLIQSNLSSQATKPLIMFGNTYTSGLTYGAVHIENITIAGNGNEAGGMVSVGIGLQLTNVQVSNVTGQYCIAILGTPGSWMWANVLVSLSALYTPSTTLPFGAINGVTPSSGAVYINGQDSIGTYFTYTVSGRPELKAVNIDISSNDSGGTGLYVSDCNWTYFTNIHTGGGGIKDGIHLYHPFADNYNFMFVLNHTTENVSGDSLMLDGSAVGKGGANMPTSVVYMGGNSSNASLSSVYATGCAFRDYTPGSGNVGAPPTSITPGSSPYTYTNNDNFDETLFITGGTVSSITYNSTEISTSTDYSVLLRHGDSVVVTYSSAPSMYKSVT